VRFGILAQVSANETPARQSARGDRNHRFQAKAAL
jgi:hypothetical protein